MFFRSSGDGLHLLGCGVHQIHNFMQCLARGARKRGGGVNHVHNLLHVAYVFAGAILDIADGVAHFLGGGHGLFRQFAHLVSNHGKSSPGFASARRFNGRIEGQQIGLVGNIRNNSQDLPRTLGLLAERGHF